MGQRVFPVALVALLLAVTLPALAADAPQATVESLIAEAHQLLSHPATQRGLHISVHATGQTPVRGNVDTAREAIIDLMANAIAFAPEGSSVAVNFDGKSDIAIKVDNRKASLTTDRDVQDCNGHAFHLRTVAGVGSELHMTINRPTAPVMRAATR